MGRLCSDNDNEIQYQQNSDFDRTAYAFNNYQATLNIDTNICNQHYRKKFKSPLPVPDDAVCGVCSQGIRFGYRMMKICPTTDHYIHFN